MSCDTKIKARKKVVQTEVPTPLREKGNIMPSTMVRQEMPQFSM
jgi:hypothetical protein